MKKIVLLLIVVLVLPAPAVAFDRAKFRTDIAWVTSASAVDLLSTRHMLNTCETCYEANPFMREQPTLKKAIATTFVLSVILLLRKHEFNTIADVVRWTAVGVFFVASGWNMYLAERGKT